MPETLWLSVLDRLVSIQCDDAEARELLACNYGGMFVPGSPDRADLEYRVAPVGGEGAFSIRCGAREVERAHSPGELLSLVKQDVVVEIQKARPDLYFVHAAALSHEGRAVLLVAESGGGKSTTAWALLHHGFRYGSDELAPVDPRTGCVHAFPSALCLKADPPDSFPLPAGAIRTPHTRYVPVECLPAPLAPFPSLPANIFFVRYRPRAAPAVRKLGAAEAGARIFAQALNALAHPGGGLDVAIDIAKRSRCFGMETGDLRATSQLILSMCS